MSSTRALVLEAFGRIVPTRFEVPPPGDGEVVVRVVATGICGSDLHGYTGENGRRVPGQIMGHETAGIVEAVGDGVESVSVGDRVTVNPVMLTPESRRAYAGREQRCPDRKVLGVAPDVPAAFADRVLVPAENVVPLDPALPVEYGALIEPLAVAVHAVARAGAVEGLPILVLGGGPIGQSVVLAGLAAGARLVIVSEPDPARRALCERLGAIAIDPADGTISELVHQHAGGPVDVVIDAVGVTATLRDAFAASSSGATICLVGMGSPEIALAAYQVSTEERTLVGSFCYSDAHFVRAAALAAERRDVLDLMVSEQVRPEEADDAFRRLTAPGAVAAKILVRFDR
ncbi:zinc-dependent alcohol dehydrogenase [Agromyces silvae]|uniref:zinc-dependent alcohol dehydrogenase n=1 Tax=Agromyces silvae TaxID=3388266 RepID=UPI00280B265E|nr:alcohol dehydrogenase catalytic domain-containing protein [Agromyces protaetiae]